MSQPHASNWEWFGNAAADAQILDRWRDARPTYEPGCPLDSSWHIDGHERIIGHDQSGKLFACAADRLLRYQFYPSDVMDATTDFGQQDRRLRTGDRILQRIHVLRLFGRPVLDVLALTMVSGVRDEPRRKGFTYVTTTAHLELGEWTATVTWRADGAVVLGTHSISKLNARVWGPQKPFARALQRRAHRRGLTAFTRATLDAWRAGQAATPINVE